MVRGEKVIALAVTFLALSILVSGYWIGRSLERGFAVNSNGMFQVSQSIQESINTANVSQNDVLDQAQAANYLHVTEDRLLEVVDAIPHVRVGGQNIFSKKALSEWVEKSNFKL
ncbi:helix-turn-helix domain-containing protein [Desulfosporosinus sp. FKA]|uniref:helix-turn-helix domain-containing protein n=1 Tax=Desulfosporosinus sp. FKA TaxID=1969834 RepID=UPI000B4A47D8|nr:helix-turn-helix domain-containing protein [Desulfosporosinus sp. FKA]